MRVEYVPFRCCVSFIIGYSKVMSGMCKKNALIGHWVQICHMYNYLHAFLVAELREYLHLCSKQLLRRDESCTNAYAVIIKVQQTYSAADIIVEKSLASPGSGTTENAVCLHVLS